MFHTILALIFLAESKLLTRHEFIGF